MRYRRFGKTELQIPVISCGGMRYQQSWKDSDPVTEESQKNLEACIRRAVELGINHIETARGYGTSEYQLGKILPTFQRDQIIVQTKVAGHESVEEFVKTFNHSMELLHLDHVDLFAFHGINSEQEWEWAQRCYDAAQQFKREGRVRHIGFSTHGSTDLIMRCVKSDLFDYVNLHWYYIFQDNWPCVVEARKRDMGVFIISPNDKGGLLYKPTQKLIDLCAPLHPMVFNGLFCLSRPEVHTLSCGVARPSDFDIHMETVRQLDQAEELAAPIVQRLEAAMRESVGNDWATRWQEGLPEWEQIPGHVNVPVILRLRNLALAYDMVDYGKMRYNLLGNGGTWFPGLKADKFDAHALRDSLRESPFADRIPEYLREAHTLMAGEERKRLQTA